MPRDFRYSGTPGHSRHARFGSSARESSGIPELRHSRSLPANHLNVSSPPAFRSTGTLRRQSRPADLASTPELRTSLPSPPRLEAIGHAVLQCSGGLGAFGARLRPEIPGFRAYRDRPRLDFGLRDDLSPTLAPEDRSTTRGAGSRGKRVVAPRRNLAVEQAANEKPAPRVFRSTGGQLGFPTVKASASLPEYRGTGLTEAAASLPVLRTSGGVPATSHAGARSLSSGIPVLRSYPASAGRLGAPEYREVSDQVAGGVLRHSGTPEYPSVFCDDRRGEGC